MANENASPQQQDSALAAAKALDADSTQYVTFQSGDDMFAVAMAPVLEIIRVPEVVRVPLAPPALLGLANLRGKILPIISLRHAFGFPPREHDDSTRALVIDLGQPLAFVVDRVASVVAVESARLESVDSLRCSIDTELLAAVIKDVGDQAMVMVLDFARLLAGEFAELARMAADQQGMARLAALGSEGADDEQASDELQLVSFAVAGQEYAIAIEDVREIVQLPEQVVHVPRSDAHVLGVMTLRQRLLPLVSLRSLFGLPPLTDTEHSRIMVVSLGQATVGLVMDSVNEVLRVSHQLVDDMPSLLARDGELAEISRICRLEQGKRLVSVLNAANLFDHRYIKEALQDMNTLSASQDDALLEALDEEVDDDEQVVVFRLAREEFGVSIDSVQEIVRVPEQLIHVPKAPACVEGVINLRGSVLPVIDLRRRLGMDSMARNETQRVVVFLIGGVCTGFIVDSVAEVLRIHKDAIEPSPRLSEAQARLLARMAKLDKQQRMVQLIDPAYLLAQGDLEELATLAA
ncbi:MAG: chemotaxis protein CheW [Vogesella sp.]|uniref:chemotaxis protein CheW n=1 Tax=Vogesella sp. TaxID=1904252 RepID=UPI0039195356